MLNMLNPKPVFLPDNNLFFYNNKYRGIVDNTTVVLYYPKKIYYENVYFPCIYENKPVLLKAEDTCLSYIAMCKKSGRYFIFRLNGWEEL